MSSPSRPQSYVGGIPHSYVGGRRSFQEELVQARVAGIEAVHAAQEAAESTRQHPTPQEKYRQGLVQQQLLTNRRIFSERLRDRRDEAGLGYASRTRSPLKMSMQGQSQGGGRRHSEGQPTVQFGAFSGADVARGSRSGLTDSGDQVDYQASRVIASALWSRVLVQTSHVWRAAVVSESADGSAAAVG